MAVGAGRRHWIALCCCGAVQTVAVRSRLTPVAIVANNSLQVFGVSPAFAACEISVAFHARELGMD